MTNIHSFYHISGRGRERVQVGVLYSVCSTYLWYKYGNYQQKKIIDCYKHNWRRKVRNNYYCVLASFLYTIIRGVQELVLASILYVMLYGGVQVVQVVQQLTYHYDTQS